MMHREKYLQHNLNIIVDIINMFYGKEIVLYKTKFHIYNGIKPDTELPEETNLLVSYGILRLDGGNYQTGEQIYILEPDKKELKQKIIKLSNNIEKYAIERFKYLIRDRKISKILES